jgi:ABC-type glucose/galactose transport system permease subunit
MRTLSSAASRLRPVIRFVGAENLSLLIVLAVEIAVIVSQSPFFLGQRNLLNSLGQNIAVLGVLAVGESPASLASWPRSR